jgi:glycosyltransferase involved in cell wall biosynthesis
MKFLFVAPRFHTNQATVVKGLIERGHEVCYLVSSIGETEDHSLIKPIVLPRSRYSEREFNKLSKKRGANTVESIMSSHFIPDMKALRNVVKEYKPEIAIFRDNMCYSLMAYQCCLEAGTVCNILYEQKPYYQAAGKPEPHPAKLRFMLYTVKKNILILLDGRKRRYAHYKRTVGVPKVMITPILFENACDEQIGTVTPQSYFLPLPYDAPRYAEDRSYGAPDGKIRILDVGKYREYKDHYLLIKALSLLPCKDRFTVTVIGQISNTAEQDYFNELKAYVAECGLADIVSLKPQIPYSEMPELYYEHDVLVLPSRNELHGMVVIEGMAHGLSAIAADTCGASCCIQNGVSGHVFKSGDAEDLSEKIEKMLEIDNVIQMGRAAYRNVVQNYSFEAYYKILNKILLDEFGVTIS